ncbi:MAG: adenine deaminase [Synergistaceae bacterium]|jgi:adenine deaminase|nr:adenine deaminase [Synergistaceae bacterium]
MRNLLSAARGETPCDLVIRGGRVANVLSMEYETEDIAIKDGIIVGLGAGYSGAEIVDAAGSVLMPGMIDGHLHIESTMLTPAAFASVVVPLGTTTVMPDPHEIANTCGVKGIEFMWRDSLRTPLDSYFAAPSCVPASGFETPYQEIGALRVMECFDRGLCTHLGEMMNFPGVISGDGDVWAKIAGARGLVRTAHAPNVSGRDLCAYLISGCDGDHESNFAEEALEKLRRGMWVMLREGATESNMGDLLPMILADEARFSRCMAVSDDLTADYILSYGHMDHKIRLMVEMGVRPLIAAAMVTINPANYFRFWDRGAIAPGRMADIVMVSSLEECRAIKVWKHGELVAENGRALFTADMPSKIDLPRSRGLKTPPCEASFRIQERPGRDIRVISAKPGSVLTKELIVHPTVRDGLVVSDVERDILKLVVMEKNRGTGRTVTGFVNGFGLKRGAIGSSVAHDAHNFIVMGADDESIMTALKYLAEHGGGLVAADKDEVISSLQLPIGGLMSELDPHDLSRAMTEITKTAQDRLGAAITQPFMTMSFLSLSVIPELKLTDQGYVKISEGGTLGLFV